MWNKDNTIRLIGKISKEYGKEIIAEGSKSVLGFEDHVDKIVASIVGVESEIVTAAREWRKIIGRAAMHEGIEKVERVLGQESIEIICKNSEESREESKTNIELLNIVNIPSIESIEVEMNTEELHTEAEELSQIKIESMKGIKVIHEKVKEKAKSLDESIWAPREERCVNRKDIKAKVSAANVLGENAEHWAKSLRWALRGNSHLKRIYEEFTKGNQWCILVFDCEKGFEDAQHRLANRKEEYEQFRLVREEKISEVKKNRRAGTNNQENKIDKKRDNIEDQITKEGSSKQAKAASNNERNEEYNEQEEKEKRNKQAKLELDEVFRYRSGNKSTNISEDRREEGNMSEQEAKHKKQEDNSNKITVWDLPSETKRTQVFEMVRLMGRVEHIEVLRSAYSRTRAIIEFKENMYNKRILEETWCLPFRNHLLVRTTIGVNEHDLLYTRNKYSTRLLDLPENTNEVLLWRQVKRSGAKALHIFKNTNDNKMRSATVFFETENDLVSSSKFAIFYNNNKLRWARREEEDTGITNGKEYRKQELIQVRSAKSLGKRKELNLDPKIECSKSAQVCISKKVIDKSEVENLLTKEVHEEKWNWRDSNRIEMSESEEESDKTIRKSIYAKRNKSNIRLESNSRDQQSSQKASLSYITQQLQNLEDKLAKIGALGANLS